MTVTRRAGRIARAKARLIAEKRITVDGDMVWIVP